MKYNIHRKRYTCQKCSKSFSSEGWYTKHMNSVHPVDDSVVATWEDVDKIVEETLAAPKVSTPDPPAEPPAEPVPVAVDFAEVYGERAVQVVMSNICPRDPSSVDIAEVSAEDFEGVLSAVEREKRKKIRK